jgi:hypothetical protein
MSVDEFARYSKVLYRLTVDFVRAVSTTTRSSRGKWTGGESTITTAAR